MSKSKKFIPDRAKDRALELKKMQAFVDAASDWLWEMDENLRFTYFSDRVTEVTGVPVEFHIGKTRQDLAGELATDERWRKHFDDLENHRPFRDFRFQRKGHDGRVQYLSSSGTPIFDEDGTFKGYVGIGTDLTATMEAENKARVAQIRLATAIEAFSEPFALWGPDDKLVLCNEAFRVLNGPVRDRCLPGTTFESYIRAAVAAGLFPELEDPKEWISRRIVAHRNPSEPFEVRRQDGQWVRVREQILPDGSITTTGSNITADKKHEEELTAAKEIAENANRTKTEFLSSMSHELRTPLNAIMGFGQLLASDPDLPRTAFHDDAIDHIIKGGRHLLDLINQILDLSRIESGNLLISIETIDTRVLVSDCLQMTKGAAGDKNVAVHVECDILKLPPIRADMVRSRQVLLNILMNAIKYNRNGGQVWLTAVRAGAALRITVRDDGPGIPVEKHGEIFTPFNRLGMEARGIEGTGIGLTISKQLVEMMGGRIGFDSASGQGATFWFELPLGDPSVRLDAFDKSADGAQVAPTSEQATPSKTILYVEDNPANVHLMQGIVRRIPDTHLVTAHTAEIGLSIARSDRPSLILMDINLPGMNGMEALREIRLIEGLQDIPVIAVTAAVLPRDVQRITRAGFDDFLAKPLEIQAAIDVINEHLH